MPTIAGRTIEHWINNAAGTCKSREDVERFARSAVAIVTVGSVTLENNPGNPGNVYHRASAYALNSLGLPNRGNDYYTAQLSHMVELVHSNNKLLSLSIAGSSTEEYVQLAQLSMSSGIDLLEINLGCPNVWQNGTQKPIPSYHLELAERIIRGVCESVDESMAIGLKLSPLFPGMHELWANLINTCPKISFLVLCNTFPNTHARTKEGEQAITGSGLAGMGGPGLKPIALGMIVQLKPLLRDTVTLIGAGGIESGDDVFDYLDVGAEYIQSATNYFNGGESCDVYSTLLQDTLERAPYRTRSTDRV